LRGRADVVALLLSRGATINEPDIYLTTPLTMAARKGYKQIVELLLSKGANIDGREGLLGGPLIIATENQHAEIVRLLLATGADVNACPQDRRTALHVAGYFG